MAEERLWRCYNPKCTPESTGIPGFDFTAPAAVVPCCPKCGLSKSHPRHAALIVPRVVLHWETPDEVVAGHGSGVAACTGNALVGRHTRAPSAVTCPVCLATPAFKAALTEVETHPDYRVPVVIDAEKGTIKIQKAG